METTPITGTDKSIQINEFNPEYNKRVIGFIKTIVAEYYQQPMSIYTIKSRKKAVVYTKHAVAYFCMKNLKTTNTEVGRALNLDHATIIYSVRKIKSFLIWDLKMKKEFNEIQSIIENKGLIQAKSLDLENDFYYIDLNNVTSIKADKDKAIILTGYSDEECERFMNLFMLGIKTEPKNHKNTGLYILERKPLKPISNEQ